MKKSIHLFAIVLCALSILSVSCNKEDDLSTNEISGEYSLTMDGSTVASGETEEIGMIGNAASVSKGEDFGILLSAVPETTGASVELGGENSVGSVSITGKNLLLNDNSDELYFSISGTIKRESSTKISFSGTCTAMGSTTVHTFSGSIESDAFKLI